MGEEGTGVEEGEKASVFVDTYGGRVQVEWDREAAMTPLGQLPFGTLCASQSVEIWI